MKSRDQTSVLLSVDQIQLVYENKLLGTGRKDHNLPRNQKIFKNPVEHGQWARSNLDGYQAAFWHFRALSRSSTYFQRFQIFLKKASHY